MSTEITKQENLPNKIISPEVSHFKGYSLEELRYQRALVALQKEFSKSKVTHSARKVQKMGFTGFTSPSGGKSMGLIGKFITGMSYLDYAMLGFSLFKSAKKVISFVKKK